MKNILIRDVIAQSGIRYWEVAEKLGIADSAFSRMLRYDLSKAKQDQILEAINAVVLDKTNGR